MLCVLFHHCLGPFTFYVPRGEHLLYSPCFCATSLSLTFSVCLCLFVSLSLSFWVLKGMVQSVLFPQGAPL